MKLAKETATAHAINVAEAIFSNSCLPLAAHQDAAIQQSTHNSTTKEEPAISRDEWETMVLAKDTKEQVFQSILPIIETPSFLARAQRLLLHSSMLYFKANNDPLDRAELEEDEAIFGFLMDAISVPLYQ